MAKKKQYKDPPRFKVIVEYENHFKKQYERMLKTAIKDLTKTMKNYVQSDKTTSTSH